MNQSKLFSVDQLNSMSLYSPKGISKVRSPSAPLSRNTSPGKTLLNSHYSPSKSSFTSKFASKAQNSSIMSHGNETNISRTLFRDSSSIYDNKEYVVVMLKTLHQIEQSLTTRNPEMITFSTIFGDVNLNEILRNIRSRISFLMAEDDNDKFKSNKIVEFIVSNIIYDFIQTYKQLFKINEDSLNKVINIVRDEMIKLNTENRQIDTYQNYSHQCFKTIMETIKSVMQETSINVYINDYLSFSFSFSFTFTSFSSSSYLYLYRIHLLT